MRDLYQVIRLLKEYKEQYGDCLVPKQYTTKDGIRLGQIVASIRYGNRKTSASEKVLLENIGFVWNTRTILSFEEVIRLLTEYKKQYGNCLVPVSYITKDRIRLGQLVNSIRKGNRKTSASEKVLLDNLGFVWNTKTRFTFKEVIILLTEYKERYGNCLVPKSYTTEDGIRLGEIVQNIRKGNRKISSNEKAILNDLGFVWQAKLSFEEIIKYLQEYKSQHGNCSVPIAYTTEDGIHLGRIVHSIRSGRRKTDADEKAMLNDLGFVWQTNLSFEEVIRLLQEYKKQHGDCSVPIAYTTEDGIHLGRIVGSIRYGNRKTNVDQKTMLNNLGFIWKAKRGRRN